MWEMEVDAALIRRMDNISDMLDRLGLAGAARSGHGSARVVGSAVRVCESCAAGDVCHDWLARAAKTLYRAPEFCPNADRFAQLLAEQARNRERTSDRMQAATEVREFCEIARKCYVLAESCADRDIALVLANMGRSYLDKADGRVHRDDA